MISKKGAIFLRKKWGEWLPEHTTYMYGIVKELTANTFKIFFEKKKLQFFFFF